MAISFHICMFDLDVLKKSGSSGDPTALSSSVWKVLD